MLLLIASCLWILPLRSTAYDTCVSKDQDYAICSTVVLKSDEPFSNPGNISSLTFSNAVGSIGTKTFSLIPQLEELTIHHSDISGIEDGALCSPPNLKNLTIHDNRNFPAVTESFLSNCDNISAMQLSQVRMEPTALKNAPNVKQIVLGLKVQVFAKDYLKSLNQVNVVTLQECEIEEFEPNAICLSPALQKVALINNKHLPVLTKSLFENCNHVIELYFDGGEPISIEEDALNNFENVMFAHFNNLNINKKLTKIHMNGLTNTRYLNIDKSTIESIDDDAFKDMDKLRKLSLVSNRLDKFDSILIEGLPHLKMLDLSHNHLTMVDNIKHQILETLNVNNNPIGNIDIEAVRINLPNLKNLLVNNLNIAFKK